MIRSSVLAVALASSIAPAAFALDAGKANGFAVIDGVAIPLAFAVDTRKENLFDAKKRDVVVVLTDKPLGATRPDNEVDLSLRARRGELVVVALRIDGDTLVNVTVSYKGLNGLVVLPGPWFQYGPPKAGVGSLRLARREFDGHSYEMDVTFAATRYVAPPPATPPAAAPAAPERP